MVMGKEDQAPAMMGRITAHQEPTWRWVRDGEREGEGKGEGYDE